MSSNFDTGKKPTWCPGCGTYVVSSAIKKSLNDLSLKSKDVVICYDIGCSGNMVNILEVCAFETLHGRSVAVASGVKAANEELTVIAQGGDGGTLNEGLSHFIHAAQRDDDITLILNNNYIFGLTAGQKTSATPLGVRARAQKENNEIKPLDPVPLAATAGATFIARVPVEKVDLIQDVVTRAIKHRGFSVIEIIQPCKIWAKDFPKIEFEIVDKPFENRADLHGKENLAGILFEK